MVSPSGCKRFDSLFDRRHARAEPAGDGAQIDAATGADELPALGQARQCLIHGRPIAEVKQALGGPSGTFGQARAATDRSVSRVIVFLLLEIYASF
jgi:hypothetical protein